MLRKLKPMHYNNLPKIHFWKTDMKRSNFEIKNVTLKRLKLIKMRPQTKSKKLNEHNGLNYVNCRSIKLKSAIRSLNFFSLSLRIFEIRFNRIVCKTEILFYVRQSEVGCMKVWNVRTKLGYDNCPYLVTLNMNVWMTTIFLHSWCKIIKYEKTMNFILRKVDMKFKDGMQWDSH